MSRKRAENMKNKYERSVVVDAVGTLDRDENGKLMLFVEGKDVSETVDVTDLLEELVGSEVQIKSVSSVGA